MTTPLPIQPRPPIRGGLDSVMASLPLDESEWRVGVSVTSEDDGGLGVWDATGCVDGGYDLATLDAVDEKPSTGPLPDNGIFYPTILTKRVTCNIGGTQTVIGDIITQSAQSSFARTQYRSLAKVLHGYAPVFSPAGDPNPNLSGMNGADEPTYPDGFDAGAPGGIYGTLEGLLDLVCGCFNSDPVFHIPRQFMAQFTKDGVIRWDESAGVFRFGPHLVSFDCYPNRGSEAVEFATPTATDGSEAWIWTSTRPMVEVAGEVLVTQMERRQNGYDALVERPAIVVFDNHCFGAAKAVVCS